MKRQTHKGAFDLIEEATHLLRSSPAGTLAAYYVGAIPFILGLLYFWTDMARNPFAGQHVAGAAFGTAVLFLWMKFWQVAFVRRLRSRFTGEPLPRLQPRHAFRTAAAQTLLQPLGLLPIGLCISACFFFFPLALPLAMVVGIVMPFFQNLTIVDDGTIETAGAVFKKAWRLWRLWPRQHFILLSILYFFSLYVFLNWLAVGITLPGLLKTLFGVESVYSRDPLVVLNSTYFAAMFGLTYLVVDPVFKAVYTLRCFYAESVRSGADLKAEMSQFSRSTHAIAVTLLAITFASTAVPARAADDSSTTISPPIESPTAPARPPTGLREKAEPISTPALDKAINQTIHERKYTWRMPREKAADDATARDSVIARFFNKIAEFLRTCLHAVGDWLEKLLRKLFNNRNPSSPSERSSGEGWITFSQLLLFLLIVVVVCALAIFIYRLWLQRQPPNVIASEPMQSVPDISDENVGADQLPEDGWTKLARELLERGEFRLAMRAFYLASLAHLAQRNLISLARFKSNRDYERELRRRGHSLPDLLTVFGDNLGVFERIWYGLHEVDGDGVGRFATNVERMKGFG